MTEGPLRVPITLNGQLVIYLAVRGHTPNTAHLDGWSRVRAQADYVRGETRELCDAIAVTSGDDPDRRLHVLYELADVVLGATTLAGYLDTTVEHCIELKTWHDQGRG